MQVDSASLLVYVKFAIFFATVTFLYYITPAQWLRILLLLIASCMFYMFFQPIYILVILALIAIDYIGGLLIYSERKRKKKITILLATILLNVAILSYFKYFNFVLTSFNSLFAATNNSTHFNILQILLPLGISFHTFQGISYTIDIFKKKHKPEKNIFKYALSILFFPQLTAGPIERPFDFIPQIKKKVIFNERVVTSGLRLILWGFFKKIVIGDRIAQAINPVFAQPDNYSGLIIFVSALLFSFQIYCDFSGYSDIAIGSARALGINLMRNFNFPFASVSVRDFWNRWHISLYSWFRDYIYFPLGGSRTSRLFQFRNILIVFGISGLWHGAGWNFILWGIINGIFIIISILLAPYFPKKIGRLGKLCMTLFTFLLISLTWIFFRSQSLHNAFLSFNKIIMFPHQVATNNASLDIYKNLSQIFPKEEAVSEALVIVFLLFFLESVQYIHRNNLLKKVFYSRPIYIRWAVYFLILFSILSFGDVAKQSFLYFTF